MTYQPKSSDCGVYRINNMVNGKVYIGSSKNIKERWWNHRHDLELNQHTNQHLQRSYNKYGKDNFLFEILELCPEDERHDIEREYIDYYQTLGICYNIAPVGQPPVVHMSEDTNGMYRHDVPSADEIAKEYMSNRISVKELAEKYNCGVNTIRRRLDKSTIDTHKESTQLGNYDDKVPSPLGLLFEYEHTNITYKGLAAKYNCSESLINHRLRKAKGPSEFKHAHVPCGDDLLIEYESSNITQKQMAKKYKCTIGCIEYRLKTAREKKMKSCPT